jgi:hemerythrin-like metal-binding protein
VAGFVWNESNQFGIASQDAEHRKLGELVERLEQRIAAKADAAELRRHFQNLYDLTETHFLHEEQLVAGTDFARTAHHEREHRYLLLILKRFCQGIHPADMTCDPSGYAAFLHDWYARHIETEDRLLAMHLLRALVPAGDI